MFVGRNQFLIRGEPMPINQRNAGFISATYQPLQVANAPTIGAATAGDTSASVAFTAPANVGGSAISAYYAVSNPDRITGSGASSPVTVSGLTNGTAYTFSVWALNTYGPSPFSGASGSVTPDQLRRGVFGGGINNSASVVNVISYINIASTGNAIDFGDLTVTSLLLGSCSSSTRGLFGGGNDGGTEINVINYITILTTGNAIDFGDLTVARQGLVACSSSTRGVFAGGLGAGFFNIIDYVTIATTGNATDFGDLVGAARYYYEGACASTTRGLFAGGYGPTAAINYITIATTGDATSFGDLTLARVGLAGCSSSTRGIFGGGSDSGNVLSNIIDYVTIASTGNATDFGDLTMARQYPGACSSPTRGVFGGGTTYTNIIDYVTIASTGNAIDFGDLTVLVYGLAACSNGHGGLS
jgi:hypothetical protein